MIPVTQPSLAPLSELLPYLEKIWASGVMTHNGPMLIDFERELAKRFNIPHVVCVSSGTAAMQLALRALDIDGGEVITTPFTFIATTNIIKWERCTPIFVDIDPETWNINPQEIVSAISPRTKAILPVHVFSSPCNVDYIDEIGKKNGIKVIYDAAHAINVEFNGKSLLSYGDVSCVSFHATKLLNSCEGGACVTSDPELASRLRRLRFFGFDEEKNIADIGMNAKMTEISAALGLANLKHLEVVAQNRREKYNFYIDKLSSMRGITFQKIDVSSYNYSYMPILLSCERMLLKVQEALNAKEIYPRRYFYPSLDEILDKHLYSFEGFKSMPISREISRRILCLPLYESLSFASIELICSIIKDSILEHD